MSDETEDAFGRFLADRVRDRVRRVREALARVRGAADGESTHALATSLRRLVVADFVLKRLFDRLLPAKHRRALRTLRKTLGRIRDILEIQKKLHALKLNTPFARAFAEWLDGEGRKEDARVTRAVGRLDDEFLRHLARKRPARRLCRGEPRETPETLRRELLRRALQLREEALEKRDDAALHRLRVRYKRYRYAVELLALPEADGAARLAYLRTLQEAMGQAHDWMVLEDAMRAFSARQPLAGVRAAVSLVRKRRVLAHGEARRYVAAELKTLARAEGIE